MTQSDCMRAEPSFPQCVVVGVGRFPGVCSDNRPICLPAQTQWPFRNGYEGITALFIWEYHIYPGAFWLLPSARVSTFTVWGGEAALHSSSHWSYTQSCFWYSVRSTSISESHQLLSCLRKEPTSWNWCRGAEWSLKCDLCWCWCQQTQFLSKKAEQSLQWWRWNTLRWK